MSGKSIALFVHECNLRAGHTRAMLEVLRSLPLDEIAHLKVFCFEHDSASELLPELQGKISFHVVPFSRLKPFLFKAIFFQIYCMVLSHFYLSKDYYRIGIGTVTFNVDLVNVQFIQSQWSPLYFKNVTKFSFKWFYKKTLFLYFKLCENLLYRRDDLKIMSLSQFVTDYLKSEFNTSEAQVKTIYSSVNLEHFPGPQADKKSVVEKLVKDHPELSGLDLKKPTYLFVGAFERKGLQEATKLLNTIENYQFIIVGKPESSNSFNLNKKNYFHIETTHKIKAFYEIADFFIFPTAYEPFGLVILEAAAMGLMVYIPRDNVGASELLEGLPSVEFLTPDFKLSPKAPLSFEEKQANSSKVKQRIQNNSWEKAGQDFLKLINFS